MTSNFVIALIVAIGGGTWVYAKTYRSTGGNNKGAILIGAIAALIVFLAAITVLNLFFA